MDRQIPDLFDQLPRCQIHNITYWLWAFFIFIFILGGLELYLAPPGTFCLVQLVTMIPHLEMILKAECGYHREPFQPATGWEHVGYQKFLHVHIFQLFLNVCIVLEITLKMYLLHCTVSSLKTINLFSKGSNMVDLLIIMSISEWHKVTMV